MASRTSKTTRKTKREHRGRGESAIYHRVRRTKTKAGVREVVQWLAVISEGVDPKTGKRRRKYLYAKTKNDAMAALQKYLIEHGGPGDATERTPIADFAGRFIENARANLAPNSAKSYDHVLRLHVLPHIGALRLDQLDAARIQRLYADLRKEGISSSLLARCHVVLRRLLNVAKKQGLLQISPMERVDAPRHKRPPAKSLTVEQLERLLKAVRNDRLEALFVLAATTGMRQGELFGLAWADVDLSRRTIAVTRSVVEVDGDVQLVEPKTPASRRRIELSQLATDALKRRLEKAKAEGHKSEHVFPSPTGRLMRKSNFLRRVYFPLRKTAKIPKDLPFHALRHTSASLLLLQGVSPKVVQEMLGHADVKLTLGTYSHLLPGLQRQAADALDALLKTPKKRIGGTAAVQGRSGRTPRKERNP